MVGIRVVLDPQLLGMPGGLQSAFEPAALLIVDALIVTWATRQENRVAKAILREGTAIGLVGGLLEIVHIALENYGRLGAGRVRHDRSLPGGPAPAVGHRRLSRHTGDCGLRRGAAGGFVECAGRHVDGDDLGFSQLLWDLPWLEQRNVGSPDLLRSGWTDLHTFTIADIFESGFKILPIGPMAGAVLGGFGALLARMILAGAVDRLSRRRCNSVRMARNFCPRNFAASQRRYPQNSKLLFHSSAIRRRSGAGSSSRRFLR